MIDLDDLNRLVEHFTDPSSSGRETWVRLKARVAALEELEAVVEAWRMAKCSWPRSQMYPESEIRCDGDNHQEECPCELALQNLIATHNKMRPR